MPTKLRSGKDLAQEEDELGDLNMSDSTTSGESAADFENRPENCCRHCHSSLTTIIDLLNAERSAAADREKRLLTRIDQLSLTVQELAKVSLSDGESAAIKTSGKNKKTKKKAKKEEPGSTVSAEVEEVNDSNEDQPDLATRNSNGHARAVRDAHQPAESKSTKDKFSSLLSSFDGDSCGEGDDALWNLVTNKKPGPRKAVYFIGNLKADETEEHLSEFVKRRAHEANMKTEVFQCTVFPSPKDKDGEPTTSYASARIVIDESSSELVTHKKFWPKPVYIRKWKFESRNGSSEPEHT